MPEDASLLGLVEVGTSCVRTLLMKIAGRDVLETVDQQERYTFAGKALDEGAMGRDRAPWRSTVSAAGEFAASLRERGARAGLVMATHAVRSASNREAALADLAQACRPWPVRALSGEEEARLTALGCVRFGPAKAAVITDVGGGSTEIVVATGPPAHWRAWSMPVGTQAITRRYDLGRSREDDAAGLLEGVLEIIDRHWPADGVDPTLPWVSTGGSALALVAVTQLPGEAALRSLAQLEGRRVEVDRVRQRIPYLARMGVEARDREYHLGAGRSEQIVSGALLHLALACALGQQTFRASSADARYGALLQLLEGDP